MFWKCDVSKTKYRQRIRIIPRYYVGGGISRLDPNDIFVEHMFIVHVVDKIYTAE